METTSDGITYYDCKGKAIALGAEVVDPNEEGNGKIVGFYAPDENWGGVWVQWPDYVEPEFFAASGSYDEVYTVDDVELAQ